MASEFRKYLDSLPQRDTTPPGVYAVEEYTFDQLITHLVDYHGYGTESQHDDECSNKILDEAALAEMKEMSREEAIRRLPYHYFQQFGTPDSLASAISFHAGDHADNFGGGASTHFHPGSKGQS